VPAQNKQKIIEKLEGKGTYSIGYRPPRNIRIKLASELKKEEFSTLTEILNTALTEWFRDREMKTLYRETVTIE
jgi:chemotaxis methyl-accepting protein methylase